MKIRWLKLVAVLLLASFFLTSTPSSKADQNLTDPVDMVSSKMPRAFSQHTLSFAIPSTSRPLTSDEYIQLQFTNYSGLVPPLSLSGQFTGVPVFEVIGTRVRISGINLPCQETISINGIYAYNPQFVEDMMVSIFLTRDADGFDIRNSAYIMPLLHDGLVTVSASIQLPLGALEVSGVTAPGMFVVFTEGGTIVGSTNALNSGVFQMLFPTLTPTLHTISVFGFDGLNRATPITTVEAYTRAYEITRVSGITLAPVLSADTELLVRGNPVIISGTGAPNYTVRLFSEPPLTSYETTTDASGSYSYTINDTLNFELGEQQVRAFLQDSNGTQSPMSFTAFFRVVDNIAPPDDGEEPACDITQGDLNCDSKVNLADFSILLYYWNTSTRVADINADDIVNLIDFSIMMFYWQG